jgi:hypothetical protein
MVFERISRGWALTRMSFRVLSLDKSMLALPLTSGVLLALVAVTFFVPMAVLRLDFQNPVSWVALFSFYVVTYYVILWFNAAVIEMATIRFNGGDPTLKDGLRKAWERKGRIFQWALVAATVGLILKALEGMAQQNNNPTTRMLGQIGVWIAGAAWHIAAFFVMPILIYRDVGPFQALKESVGTWKSTWGEAFTAIFTTGVIFLLLGFLGIVPIALAAMTGSGAMVIGAVTVAVAYWVLLWAANTAVDGIIVAALFKYSVDGELPEAFRDAPVPATPQPVTPYA